MIILRVFVTALLSLSCHSLFAAKAPMTIEDLDRESRLIVSGEVLEVRVEAERSRVERGFGNRDWGIYLTIRVDSVDKGQIDSGTLEARCFRIKSRISMAHYFSESGHDYIPEVGAYVTLYLQQRNGGWNVISPNGVSGISSQMPEAEEVERLWSLPYTFLIPAELWLIALPALLLIRQLYRRKKTSPVDNNESV